MDSFKNPAPTVDAVIFYKNWNNVILIERKNPPEGLALPGGFVNEGETLETAVHREVGEELSVNIFLLEQFLTYSDPKRDPRKHVMSTVFLATTTEIPKAGDDAKSWEIADLNTILDWHSRMLAFDHAKILQQVKTYRDTGVRPRFGAWGA